MKHARRNFLSAVIHSVICRYSLGFQPLFTQFFATFYKSVCHPRKTECFGACKRSFFFKMGEELEKKDMKVSRSRSTALRFLTFTRLGRGRSRLKRILQGNDRSDADQRNILKGGHEGREENQSEAAAPLNGGDRFFAWILRAENSRLHFHLMPLSLPRGARSIRSNELYIFLC